MNTKIARSIETTVLSKFLEKMNSSKDSFSTVDEVYKMMESLKKTEFITEDEIIQLGKKRKPYRVAPKTVGCFSYKSIERKIPVTGNQVKRFLKKHLTNGNMSNDDKQPYTDEAEKLMSDWKIKIKADKPDEKTDDTPTSQTKNEKSSKKEKKDSDQKSTKDSEKEPDFTDCVKYLKSSTNHQWCYVNTSDDNTFSIHIKSGKEGGKQQYQEKTFDSKEELDKYIQKETSVREKKGYSKC